MPHRAASYSRSHFIGWLPTVMQIVGMTSKYGASFVHFYNACSSGWLRYDADFLRLANSIAAMAAFQHHRAIESINYLLDGAAWYGDFIAYFRRQIDIFSCAKLFSVSAIFDTFDFGIGLQSIASYFITFIFKLSPAYYSMLRHFDSARYCRHFHQHWRYALAYRLIFSLLGAFIASSAAAYLLLSFSMIQ